MKKLFAILLVLAMLIPMGTVAQAAESADKPFYLIQWSAVEPGMFTNVYSMPFMWFSSAKFDTPLESCSFGGDYNIETNATALKAQFEGYPDGACYINFMMPQTAFATLAEDVFFVEEGVAAVQEWLHGFLPVYKDMGGRLDGVIIDIEFEAMRARDIEKKLSVQDPLVYDHIVNNPVYKEKIRPELEARGFKFYPNPTEYTPEIYSIHSSTGDEYTQSRSIWEAVVRNYMNQCVNEAVKEISDYYPDCEINDYQSRAIKPWVNAMGEYGAPEGGGGLQYTVGNSSNENTYSVRPYGIFKPGTYPVVQGYNRAIYENKPYNYFQFDANLFKGVYQGADDNKISAWIAHYMYNAETPQSVSMTPYYVETIYHIVMLNPKVLLGFITKEDLSDEYTYNACINIIDKAMQEMTRVAGKADREAINVKPNWNNHYVLSGMRVENKNVWRITPDTSLVSREEFKAEGADPTFYVNGQTVTFPQGKILEESNIPGLDADYNDLENQTYGYWVETPAGVNPVETRAENYHVEYPAYGEDYDSYKVGMEYNFKNALPEASWEVKKSGKTSSATIVANPADAEDNVLELKGTYTIRLVNMPKNITAASSYAENQAWQVSATVPADMGAEAEVVLLSAGSEKKKSNDGGFKIAGGKVYYSDNGEYKEMTGVTLTAGSEYTFKREMDFNNAEQLKSSYYVYDNTGALVGKAKNVAMSPIDLPIASVTMSCSKVDAGAILLDDFKLCLDKVGSDFTLYEAKHGMRIADQENPYAGDVGYNYSWINTTNVEKSYSIVAQYYNGDAMASEEVIKEVKMAPNSEGVEYGVVELGEKGKAVKIFIKDNNPAEEDDTTGTGDNTGDDTGKTDGFVLDTKMIIIIAAAAAVLIAVVVIVIVVSSKKKAAKKAAAAIEETPAEEAPAVEETPVAEETPTEEAPETDAE